MQAYLLMAAIIRIPRHFAVWKDVPRRYNRIWHSLMPALSKRSKRLISYLTRAKTQSLRSNFQTFAESKLEAAKSEVPF